MENREELLAESALLVETELQLIGGYGHSGTTVKHVHYDYSRCYDLMVFAERWSDHTG